MIELYVIDCDGCGEELLLDDHIRLSWVVCGTWAKEGCPEEPTTVRRCNTRKWRLHHATRECNKLWGMEAAGELKCECDVEPLLMVGPYPHVVSSNDMRKHFEEDAWAYLRNAAYHRRWAQQNE